MQGGCQNPPITISPHRHFRFDSVNSLASCPTTAGDTGRKRVYVNYERGCCLSSKHLERLNVTEKTNWSQRTRAGKGRKVCQCFLGVTCSHGTCAENRCRDWHASCPHPQFWQGIYSFTPELSQQTSLYWLPDPKAQPELANPFTFRQSRQDNATDTHSTIGKTTVQTQHGALYAGPGAQGSPQSITGLTKRRQGLRQSSAAALGLKERRGPPGLGAGPQQPATSGALQYTKAVGLEERHGCPKKHKPGEARAQNPLSPVRLPQARHKGSTVFNFIPHPSGLERGSGKHQLPAPACKASEADSLMRDIILILFKKKSQSSRTSCLK